MALTANKVLISDNNGAVAASSTDSGKLSYLGSITSNCEQTGNKVTSLSSANTNTQYPSAKAVYDAIVPNVTASYSAVSNKGGTLPATQNLANLSTAIDSIPAGGSDIGITREVSGSGVYQMPSSSFTFSLPSNATDLGRSALSHAFYYSSSLTGFDFSNLTTISGSSALSYAFYTCSNLTSVSFPSLTTISGSSAFSYSFACSSLSSISFPALTTISGGSAFYYAFSETYNLTSVTFTSLTTLSGSNALSYAFESPYSLESLYFPALTTSSFVSTSAFANMLKNAEFGTVTLHFPSNLQATIQGLTGYPYFGGDDIVLAFDLPATS